MTTSDRIAELEREVGALRDSRDWWMKAQAATQAREDTLRGERAKLMAWQGRALEMLGRVVMVLESQQPAPAVSPAVPPGGPVPVLLPCPFCGAAAEAHNDSVGSEEPPDWFIICSVCRVGKSARGEGRWTAEQARAAWNTRASDLAVDAARPCYDCGSSTATRSPCPVCGKVVCDSCAEAPYKFCCDEPSTPAATSTTGPAPRLPTRAEVLLEATRRLEVMRTRRPAYSEGWCALGEAAGALRELAEQASAQSEGGAPRLDLCTLEEACAVVRAAAVPSVHNAGGSWKSSPSTVIDAIRALAERGPSRG